MKIVLYVCYFACFCVGNAEINVDCDFARLLFWEIGVLIAIYFASLIGIW